MFIYVDFFRSIIYTKTNSLNLVREKLLWLPIQAASIATWEEGPTTMDRMGKLCKQWVINVFNIFVLFLLLVSN